MSKDSLPPEAYALDMLQHELETDAFLTGEDTKPYRSPLWVSLVERLRQWTFTPHDAVCLFSFLIVVVCSVYFHIPSTLFVYLVALYMTIPLCLLLDIGHMVSTRALPTRVGPWLRIGLFVFATLYATSHVVVALMGVPYENPRGPRIRRAGADYNPTNATYFIASNLYNSEAILPSYRTQLLQFIADVGVENVFVSIYENDSIDATPAMLQALDAELGRRGIRRRILTIKKRKGFKRLSRIAKLAYLRNQAMEPIFLDQKHGLDGRPFSKVVFLNDIVFAAESIHELLDTAGGRFDQACAIDYFTVGLYDTYVL